MGTQNPHQTPVIHPMGTQTSPPNTQQPLPGSKKTPMHTQTPSGHPEPSRAPPTETLRGDTAPPAPPYPPFSPPPGNQTTRPWSSSSAVWGSRMRRRAITRGGGSSGLPVRLRRAPPLPGPLLRMTATPQRPCPEETAKMVSPGATEHRRCAHLGGTRGGPSGVTSRKEALRCNDPQPHSTNTTFPRTPGPAHPGHPSPYERPPPCTLRAPSPYNTHSQGCTASPRPLQRRTPPIGAPFPPGSPPIKAPPHPKVPPPPSRRAQRPPQRHARATPRPPPLRPAHRRAPIGCLRERGGLYASALFLIGGRRRDDVTLPEAVRAPLPPARCQPWVGGGTGEARTWRGDKGGGGGRIQEDEREIRAGMEAGMEQRERRMQDTCRRDAGGMQAGVRAEM